jgi:hypothetical protein
MKSVYGFLFGAAFMAVLLSITGIPMNDAESIRAVRQAELVWGEHLGRPVHIQVSNRYCPPLSSGCFHPNDGSITITVGALIDTCSRYRVALHEVGHALGYSHQRGNVMAGLGCPPLIFPDGTPIAETHR